MAVEIHSFDSVPERVAIAEGEGDLSLSYWREAHASFFAPYLAELGISELGQAEIVTEFFEVLYQE